MSDILTLMLPKRIETIDVVTTPVCWTKAIFDDERQPPFWTGTRARKYLTLRPLHRIPKPNVNIHMQQYVSQFARLMLASSGPPP